MFIVDKNKYLNFNNAMDRDSNIRFIFYLYDNYPLLKLAMPFEDLFSVFKVKKEKYENVYLMMEAEVVFGEYFLKDLYLEDKISNILELSFFDNELEKFIIDYKKYVIGEKQEKLITYFIDRQKFDCLSFVENKKKFLEIDGNNIVEVKNFIFGVNYENNIYYSGMELK